MEKLGIAFSLFIFGVVVYGFIIDDSSNKSAPVNNYYPESNRSFKDYPCTVDCSGHEAGFEWAEDNSIEDASDCNGNSNSFNEGCNAWVEENVPEDNRYDDFDTGRFGN